VSIVLHRIGRRLLRNIGQWQIPEPPSWKICILAGIIGGVIEIILKTSLWLTPAYSTGAIVILYVITRSRHIHDDDANRSSSNEI